jgi:uncharacterized protein
MMRTLNIPLTLATCAAILASGCSEPSISPEEHDAEVSEWQSWRLADLTAEDSWLSLVGYHVLNDGSTSIGASPEADLVTPRGPDRIGRIEIAGGEIRFIPAPGVSVTANDAEIPAGGIEVVSERDGDPTIMRMGAMSWYVKFFQDRFAIRMRDNENHARTDFPGLEYFPVNRDWRLPAYFEPYDPPKRFPVSIFTGGESVEESPGAVVFEVDGVTYRLDVTDTSDTGYFVIFSDETSRSETYPAGRYVWFDRPASSAGPVTLDFNKAYNPPCAFNDFATCPLPPRSHRIQARIKAGELRFRKS